MFGINAFGLPYFGQILPSGAARLGASAVVSVATAATLITPPALTADSTITLATAPTLTSQGPLLAEATISISVSSPLALRAVLAASASLHLETVGTVVVPGTLLATSTLPIAVTGSRLDVGAVTVASLAGITLSTIPPRLSTLPADWRAAPQLHVGTTASLTQTGGGATDVVIAIGGAITSRVRMGSIVIDDVLNEAPNTCEFVVDESPPAVGTDIKIGLQNLLGPNLLFAGTVKSRQQFYEPRVTHPVWSIRCDDYTFLLNRRQVFGSYTNLSASLVATELVTKYTNGFSTSGIVPDLPPVTVTFTGQTVMDALVTIASLIGGYAKVDYSKVVSVFVTSTAPPPSDLVPTNRTLMHDPPVRVDADATQTRTRVFVVGASASVLGPPDTSLGPPPAITYANALAGGYSNNVAAKNVAYLVGSGVTYLLAFISGDATSDRIISASYGPAMTLLHKFYSGWQWFYLFGLANPPQGFNPLFVNASAPCSVIGITVASYSGVLGPSTIVHDTAENTASFGLTVSAANAWAVSFARFPSGALASVVGGALRASENTDGVASVADSNGAAGSPITFASAAPASWAGISVALVASGAGAPMAIPVSESAMFEGGTQVLADDGQILNYTDTAPGGQSAVVVGNVAGPSSGGTPALAVGVAGRLSGTYQWAVAFANSAGETGVGPKSAALFCPDVTSPTSAPGLGASGSIGPLVGAYDYRVSYLTTLGETLPGPSAHRTAVAIAPPSTSVGSTPGVCRLSPGTYKWLVTYVTAYGETGAGAIATGTQGDIATAFAPSVQGANGAGPLASGAPYAYRSTFVTQDGESAPGGVTTFTPSALALAGVGGFDSSAGFGGLLGGAYYYGITFVTYLGESPMNIQFGGSSLAGPYPGWAPSWNGQQDQNGRIQQGYTYTWAASYYSDIYGEGGLGPGTSQFVGGSVPIRMGINISNFRPTGADGVRIYRAIQGGGPFLLNMEFRFTNFVPTSYWDIVSQGECGSNFPIQTQRAGVAMNVTMYPSNETGVIARRLYRTKAGGAEYFLVSEIQNNLPTQIRDAFADTDLQQRNPVPTTGRIALVSVPTGPSGTIGRRVYRSKRDVTSALFFVGEIRDNATPSLVDMIPDEALTTTMPTANTGGSSSIPLVAVPTGPAGVLKRRIYRTQANGSTFALLAEIGDNVTTSYTDNIPDAALSGGTPPPVSTAGGEAIQVTSIPIGPTGTLARLIYRTRAGGGEYGEVTRISDNSTTTYLDTVPDQSLGGGVSLVNEAGSSAVTLTNIPIGPASVTQRILYRTLAGGADLHYVGTIDDNTTTSFLDTRADTQLGRTPQATSTIGALVGDTALALDSGATAFPTAGWIRADNQFVRYGGKSGTTLTGIPAAGPGAIVAAIRGGSAVLTVPMLVGVSVGVPLPVGSRLALFVTVNSAAGQAALAAAEGGDGVHEFTVVDTSLETVDACTARGNAELLLFQYVQLSLEYASRDRLTQSGATITVNLPAPLNLSGSFMIQSVRISEIDLAPRTFPLYTVRASSTKFSLTDLLRHVVISTKAVA